MVTINEEGESMHSVCFFMSYKTSWFMEKLWLLNCQNIFKESLFKEFVKESIF